MSIVPDKRRVTEYADQLIASGTREGDAQEAEEALRIVCRRSGVDPELLLDDARRRAWLRNSQRSAQRSEARRKS